MKNYEEMAQSVLKRRDMEIKRRRRAFLIGAPCAAAALVGVVGIGAAVASQSRGKFLVTTVATPANPQSSTINIDAVVNANAIGYDTPGNMGAADSGIAEIINIDPPASTAEVAAVSPVQFACSIKVLYVDKFPIAERVDRSSMTFFEYDLEELGFYYGLDLNRLGKLHPGWKMSHDKLGLYNVKFEVIDNSKRITPYGIEGYDVNTLNYTTDSGALITVSAKQGKFESVSKEVFTRDKPTDPSKFTTETAYDDSGVPFGAINKPIDPNDWRPETDAGVSTVNGYEALIYRDADGNFLADIDIASRVRITAEGLSQKEFIEVLYDFTKRTDCDIALDCPVENELPVNDYTNPKSGINDIKVLDIDTIKQTVSGDILILNDFTTYRLEQLDSFYGLRFNRLGELNPNWELYYNDLGVYRRETINEMIASLEMYYTLNTLEYTTESGAKVSVSAQYDKFEPVSDEVFTVDKPFTPSYPQSEPVYDDNGNIIGMQSASYNPDDDPDRPTPDEGVSIVNGYEALIYHYTVDGIPEKYYVADLDMNSRVRIIAEGLSEEEFLKVLDDFTK